MKTFLPPTLIVFLSLRENVKRKKKTQKNHLFSLTLRQEIKDEVL